MNNKEKQYVRNGIAWIRHRRQVHPQGFTIDAKEMQGWMELLLKL
jgi:hypothetical protein